MGWMSWPEAVLSVNFSFGRRVLFAPMSDCRKAVSEHPVSKSGLVKVRFGNVNDLAEVSVLEVSSC